MNWYFVLELAAIVVLVNVTCLPWAWLAWDRERIQPCVTFHATALPEYRIHLDQTQVLPATRSNKARTHISYVSTWRRLTKLTGGFTN
jgi:uncharacterized protein YjiK